MRHHILAIAATLAASSLSLAGPVTPPADAVGPTMKTLTQIEPRTPVAPGFVATDTSSVFMITEPGSYYLTGPVNAPAGRPAITIWANNVTLDLNGYTVTCEGTTTDAIYSGFTNVTIRNGTVIGGRYGVYLTNTNVRLEEVRVVGCALDGIRTGASSIIRDCIVESSGGTGIQTAGHGRITGCSVRATGATGINAGAHSLVTECTVAATAGDGIVVNSYGRAEMCVVREAGDDGFSLFAGSAVSRCTAHQCNDNGFEAAARVAIESCTAVNNSHAGFHFSAAGGVIRGCVASSNGYGIYSETGSGWLLTDNECTSNTWHGLWMSGATSCRIEGNQFNSNSGSGAVLSPNGKHLFVRNSARGNGSVAFSLHPSSDYGQIIINPGSGFNVTNPWANFSY